MIPLNRFASGVLEEIVRRQPASKERTSFAWQLAVGQALARVTTVDLGADGVLSVKAIDPRWLVEIERARDAVLQKMQHLLGKSAVSRIHTRSSGT
jgi:predicted nucleic acid-binding Zn ribbon protein